MTMRHNNVWDIGAKILKTNLNDVKIEPKPKKIDDERLNGLTSADVN